MRLADLAFDRYRVRLRLTRPARLRFLHGGVLRGLISRALEEHDLPPGVIPFAPESGRVELLAGDAYELGITLVGDERRLAGRLLAGLVKVGASQPSDGPLPTLGGNFELESIEPLPPADLLAEAAALAAAPATTLQMLSPLRLKRPRELVRTGAAYLNADGFPARHFLERLWARLFLLAAGRYPEPDETRRLMPPLPVSARATPGDMPWLDLPMAGGRGKEKPYTLGGVMGCVRLRAVPPDWLPVLALGRHLHAGAGTAYGLGRFRILEATEPEPFRPAQPLWSGAAGENRFPISSDAERNVRWRRSIETLIEDSSQSYRLGLSRAAGDRAERAALRDGFRWRAAVDLLDLLALVDLGTVVQRARALFPLDPPPRLTPRSPRQLREPHALLVLPEIVERLPPHHRLARTADGFFLLARVPQDAALTPHVSHAEQVARARQLSTG
jgi:hypothetical protein